MAMMFFQFVKIAIVFFFFSFLFSPQKNIHEFHDNSASKKDYPKNRKTTSLKRILVMTSAKKLFKGTKTKKHLQNDTKQKISK